MCASGATPFRLAEEAVEWLRARVRRRPVVAIVAGSGLGGLVHAVSEAERFPYADIPHFPVSTVAGHAGELIVGSLAGVEVCLMGGRVHFYEGYTMHQVTLPVRVMAGLGARICIVTNAAGGINPDFAVGDIMVIRDHINLPGLAGHNPLRGPNDERWGPRFPDLSNAYSPTLRRLARQSAGALGLTVREGVYAMVAGPNYETPAELRLLRLVGADAVGMSTVPEVLVARHAGVRVLGLSLITNKVILEPREDDAPLELHQEVLDVGARRADDVRRLIVEIVTRLAPTL